MESRALKCFGEIALGEPDEDHDDDSTGGYDERGIAGVGSLVQNENRNGCGYGAEPEENEKGTDGESGSSLESVVFE